MDLDEETPGDASLLLALMDPHTVLELINIAETSITDKEVKALHTLIAEMGKHIRIAATGPKADELLLWARQLVGLTIR